MGIICITTALAPDNNSSSPPLSIHIHPAWPHLLLLISVYAIFLTVHASCALCSCVLIMKIPSCEYLVILLRPFLADTELFSENCY